MAESSKKQQSADITQRLKSAIANYSLNEVARRTGTAPASVHRYVHGSKIPAEFCARLVQEFQVNPSWLLTGEGTRDLSDIASTHSELASELLDMVQAMNAVAQMRMGALTGKHHERVLRELNDALRRYEELRGRIGKHAKPIYDDLARQLEKSMTVLDIDAADDLMRAVDQVERLCFDDAVSVKHLALKARFSLLKKQFNQAYEYQRRLFRMPLGDAALDNDEACTNAMRLAITLENAGDDPKALRVGRAAMILCEGHEGTLKDYPMLAANTGYMMVREGMLFEGLQLLQRWVGKIEGEGRQTSLRHKWMISMLLAGALTPENAFDWGKREQIKALDLLQIAMLDSEPELLQRAIDYYNSPETPKYKVYEHRQYVVMYAEAVLLARRGDRKAALSKHEKASSQGPAMARHVLTALFYRILGDMKKSKTHVLRAIKAYPQTVATPLPILMAAIHHQNVLENRVTDATTSNFIEKYRDYVLFPFARAR